MAIVLAVDAMGGDHGINITIPACIKFIKENANVRLLLTGDSKIIYEHLKNTLSFVSDRIEIIHTTQTVEMDESPQSAMRNKKDSSMRVAIDLVKSKKAQAIISAGNTGALMAIARYVLRTMDGIDRPAIAKLLPTVIEDQPVCVLDLGASIESSPQHLLQFAIMGTQLMRGVNGKNSPSIGILNVGREAIKGNDNIKQASELLANSNLNFYGNIEGDDINRGTVDVVVCDGFTGNVALKTMEGCAKMISSSIKREFRRTIVSTLIALIAKPVLNRIKNKFDTRKYNGAILLGLNALVIKSHGGADEIGFYYALKQAYDEVNAGFIPLLQEYLINNKELLTDKDEPKLAEFQYLSTL